MSEQTFNREQCHLCAQYGKPDGARLYYVCDTCGTSVCDRHAIIEEGAISGEVGRVTCTLCSDEEEEARQLRIVNGMEQ